jgi:hypothetical protein
LTDTRVLKHEAMEIRMTIGLLIHKRIPGVPEKTGESEKACPVLPGVKKQHSHLKGRNVTREMKMNGHQAEPLRRDPATEYAPLL